MNNLIKAIKQVAKEFFTETKEALKDFKSFKTMKKQIPNIFTFSRLMLVPFIVSNILAGNLILAGLLTIGASLTDGVDGFLARKLNVTSEYGRKLDALIDKVFVVAVALPLTVMQPFLILPITFDIIIGSINGYSHLKGYNPQTNSWGKKKTVALDALVSSSFFTSISAFVPITAVLYITTISLQIKTGIEYHKFLEEKKKEDNENNKENTTHSEAKNDEEFTNKVELNKDLSDIEILKYYKEQCLNNKDEEKEKQMIIKKN
jgi:CDP-diacylglycerol--glycerol-3-phosphate 3-phosphatidyltransferase